MLLLSLFLALIRYLFSILPLTVYLNVWSGSVYHQICLGSGPRGLLIPKKILTAISSFVTLFESAPSCLSLIDCSAILEVFLLSSLPGQRPLSALCSFGPADFERCLAVPTSKILERHDFRTIIDFLLMILRTALDRDWLYSLPELHKVILFLSFFLSQVVVLITNSLSILFRVYLVLIIHYKKLPS